MNPLLLGLRIFSTVLLLLFLQAVSAQETTFYKKVVKDPGKRLQQRCKKPLTYLQKIPAEARFSTYIQDRTIYLYFPNAEVFYSLIKHSRSGFAIDLVFRKQYDCTTSHSIKESIVKGQLQKPLFKKELKKRLQKDAFGGLVIPMGQLPETVTADAVEPNLIYLYRRYACYYSSIYDVNAQDWELLENGLYQDTLTLQNSLAADSAAMAKTLRFTLPFEKNRADYQPADILALYDSLRLTDYTITRIRIMALTSVEGSEEYNKELQQKRAQSLVTALETYQGSRVKAEIFTSENWKEFRQDIRHTPYAHFATSTISAIKKQLAKPEIAAALEPVLMKHRKGLVELQLRKTISFKNESTEGISRYFQQFLQEEDITKAQQLQDVIFDRIRNTSLPTDFLGKLPIPEHPVYGPLLLRRVIFQHTELNKDEEKALEAFQQLQKILPASPELAYNIAVLQLKQWTSDPQAAEEKILYTTINGLTKKGIPQTLVNRLLLNYYIVQAQQQLFAHQYKEKDRYLRLIQRTYSTAYLTNEDALRLASYFAFYSRFEWAQRLLEQRVKQPEVAEDILFYYLNLTITEKRYTQSDNWRQIMRKAYQRNPERYCQLFNTRGFGGVSFQLLNDRYLWETYCSHCTE